MRQQLLILVLIGFVVMGLISEVLLIRAIRLRFDAHYFWLSETNKRRICYTILTNVASVIIGGLALYALFRLSG